MSMAIAYQMKKKKKCHGGEMMADGGEPYSSFAKGVKDAFMGDQAKASVPSPSPEKKPHEKDLNPATSNMKKAFNTPGYADGGGVRGVHKSHHRGSGESMAGYSSREAHKSKNGPLDADKEIFNDYAKAEHKRVHGEIKDMKHHDRKYMAEGGFIKEEKASGYEPMPHPCENCGHTNKIDSRMLNQHGADEVGAEGMDEDSEHHMDRKVSHPVENQDDHEDMVGHIMKKRMKHYSHGGKVANDTPPIADSESADYDDLVKDDDLEFHETGKNSGDEIGDAQEDEDERDMISSIMRSRKKKDKMPRPA